MRCPLTPNLFYRAIAVCSILSSSPTLADECQIQTGVQGLTAFLVQGYVSFTLPIFAFAHVLSQILRLSHIQAFVAQATVDELS
jgi:hypothetical protein